MESRRSTARKRRSVLVALGFSLFVAVQSYWTVRLVRGEAYAFWGIVRGDQESPEITQEVFRRAVTQNPWRADWWLRYGAASRRAGSADDADVAIRFARALSPHDVEALVKRAELHTLADRFAEADDALTEGFAIVPDYWRLHFAEGFNLGRQGEHAGALESYEQAYRWAFAYDKELELQMARAYLEAARPDTALKHLARVLSMDDADPEAWRLQGETLLARNQPEPALDAFEKAVTLLTASTHEQRELLPISQAAIFVGVGRAQALLDRPFDAIRSYLEASQLDPQYTAEEMQLAGLEESLTDPTPMDRFNLGQLYLLGGDAESAVRLLREALTELQDRKAIECVIVLSLALRELGRGQEAVDALESVSPPPGLNQDYRLALAESYAAAGKPATAQMQLGFLLTQQGLSVELRAHIEARIQEIRDSTQ